MEIFIVMESWSILEVSMNGLICDTGKNTDLQKNMVQKRVTLTFKISKNSTQEILVPFSSLFLIRNTLDVKIIIFRLKLLHAAFEIIYLKKYEICLNATKNKGFKYG